jgi:hypothetical protein
MPEFLYGIAIKEAAHMFSYQTDDAIRLAKILLEGWRAADAFEAKYLSYSFPGDYERCDFQPCRLQAPSRWLV